MNLNEKDFSGKNMKTQFTGFVLFYTTWCGFCNQIKPMWKQLASKIEVASVDCTENNKNMIKIFDIKGFPSIQAFQNGSYVGEYDGDRTEEALLRFFDHNLKTGNFKSGTNNKKCNLPNLSNVALILLAIILFICIFLYFKNQKKK